MRQMFSVLVLNPGNLRVSLSAKSSLASHRVVLPSTALPGLHTPRTPISRRLFNTTIFGLGNHEPLTFSSSLAKNRLTL